MKHFYSCLSWSLILLSFVITGCSDDESETELPSDLFSISVEKGFTASQYRPEKERWAYLTDHDGKTIGEPHMLVDNLEYTWEKEAGYNLESVSFNVLYYMDDIQIYYENNEMKERTKRYFFIHTYTDVIDQEAKFTPEIYQTYTDEWFDANLKIQTDLPPDYLHQIRKQSSQNSFLNGTQPEIDRTLSYKQEDKHFLLLYASSANSNDFDSFATPMYYWLSPEPNSSTTLHTSDYQAVEDFRITLNTQEMGVTLGDIRSYGQLTSGETYLLNDDSFSTLYPLKEFNAFRVPKVFSDNWLTLTLFRHDRTQAGSYKNSNIPSTASINELRNITLNGNLEEDVTVSTTGPFTEAVIIWNHESKESPNSDLKISRYLRTASKQQNRTFRAEIPPFLLERFPDLNRELTYRGTYLYDYFQIDTYHDLFKIFFNMTPKGERLQEYESTIISPKFSQGNERQLNQPYSFHLPEEHLYHKSLTY